MTIGRTELIDRMVARTELTKTAASEVIAAWEGLLLEAISRGEAIKLPGLFAIEVVERAERQGRNPRTGEAITIAARQAVKITPGAQLKAAVVS